MTPPIMPPNPNPRSNITGLLAVFLITMGCLILICVLGTGYLALRYGPELLNQFNPTASAGVVTPPQGVTPVTGASVTPPAPVDLTGALETLKTLSQAEVPINDRRDMAGRFKGIQNIPATLPAPAQPLQVGDEQKFWTVNDDTDQHGQVQARLSYITDHLYFWIQDNVKVNQANLKTLCETFENKIYPTDRSFFGSEWTPGIDNDVHLYILFTGGIGGRVAGYFSSADEIPPQAFPTSNAHEMFVMNADSFTNLTDPFIYAVLAHEFQHMIHWYQDRNEESWMNEGFSELAAFLNGYGVGGHDSAFSTNPDLQLNDWPNDKNATLPHYGASFLYLDYLLDRLGPKVTQAVVAEQENGLTSIDKVLTEMKVADPATHAPITADDLFVDWTLTNYLKDKSVGDGRFTYTNYANAPQVKETETLRSCPVTHSNQTVNQYGANYIRVTCRGNYTLSFQGSRQVGVIPSDAHSGQYALWSNKGDESDMSLSQTFDFSTLPGPINFSYWTWYDLEQHYDFVYLSASTDGGKTWEIIKTPSSTDDNVSGSNYGWGYNNKSNNWIQEKVDLAKYAGQKVTLRFDYVTDAAVNGEGFLLDDMEIPQVNYKTDFEKDTGGWTPSGFARIQNRLPQTFRVSLIQSGQTRSVQYLPLNPDGTLSVPLNLTADAILVVSGTTRFTRQPATYSYSIQP